VSFCTSEYGNVYVFIASRVTETGRGDGEASKDEN